MTKVSILIRRRHFREQLAPREGSNEVKEKPVFYFIDRVMTLLSCILCQLPPS